MSPNEKPVDEQSSLKERIFDTKRKKERKDFYSDFDFGIAVDSLFAVYQALQNAPGENSNKLDDSLWDKIQALHEKMIHVQDPNWDNVEILDTITPEELEVFYKMNNYAAHIPLLPAVVCDAYGDIYQRLHKKIIEKQSVEDIE